MIPPAQPNPENFTGKATRRIRSFAAASSAPLVVGDGCDGQVYVWNVEARTLICSFPTSPDNGGVSVALTPNGRECVVGTYYAWGVACVEVPSTETRWHRTDLRRVYGLSPSADATEVVGWFDRRAGVRLDLQTGQLRAKRPGLGMFAASRFDNSELSYARHFELAQNGQLHHKWPRDSFAVLACAFSPRLCVVSESAVPTKAIELASGKVAWIYQPRDGAHLIELDFCPSLDRFVALEYAYTEAPSARRVPWSPCVSRLVRYRRLSEADSRLVGRSVCADGRFLLNGLGELYDSATARVTHVFDFPR